jgi:hypothetical protein
MKKRKKLDINFLGWVALLLGIAGAVASLYLMFNAGRNQASVILIILFTLWVLSPFVGLLILNKFSKRWVLSVRMTLYWLAIIMTILSVTAYSGGLNTPDTKNAFMFLVIPFISWIIIVMSFFIGRRVSGRSRSN